MGREGCRIKEEERRGEERRGRRVREEKRREEKRESEERRENEEEVEGYSTFVSTRATRHLLKLPEVFDMSTSIRSLRRESSRGVGEYILRVH